MSSISTGTTTTTGYVVASDTTGALVLKTGASATTAVTIDTSQNATFAQTANLPNTFGFKNRIINGAMVIDQRNAGASVTPTSQQYGIDRWINVLTQTAKFSVQQNAGSLSAANRPVGFTNYLGITSLASYAITATDVFTTAQRIEAFNVADLNWGTANAQTVTLSFWVRSSLTGTFGGVLRNNADDYTYPFAYTISSANTWTAISLTIAGPTAGTWATGNQTGIKVIFGLGVGATYSGTAGSWSANYYESSTGATSVVGTNGATFYITGVQLEVGTVATSFDYRPYGTELALCQRYLPVWSAGVINGSGGLGTAYSTTKIVMPFQLPVPARTATTGVTAIGTFTVADGVSSYAVTSTSFGGPGTSMSFIEFTVASGLTQFRPYYVYASATGLLLFTGCEL